MKFHRPTTFLSGAMQRTSLANVAVVIVCVCEEKNENKCAGHYTQSLNELFSFLSLLTCVETHDSVGGQRVE